MEITFDSLDELYHRLAPAMSTKIAELRRNDVEYITKDDIWNFLEETTWKNATNLALHQMVDNILNVDNDKLIEFVDRGNNE